MFFFNFMWIMVAQMLCKNPPKAGAFLCGNAAGKGCTEASCLGEPGPGREAKVWKPRSPGKALTTVELDPSFCSDSKWSLRISKSNQINILWFIKDHFISLSKFHTCQFQFNGVMKFIQNPSEKNSMTPMTKAAQVLCSLLEGVKRLHCPSPRSKVAKTVFFFNDFQRAKKHNVTGIPQGLGIAHRDISAENALGWPRCRICDWYERDMKG